MRVTGGLRCSSFWCPERVWRTMGLQFHQFVMQLPNSLEWYALPYFLRALKTKKSKKRL